jgi:hypothetical protein
MGKQLAASHQLRRGAVRFLALGGVLDIRFSDERGRTDTWQVVTWRLLDSNLPD